MASEYILVQKKPLILYAKLFKYATHILYIIAIAAWISCWWRNYENDLQEEATFRVISISKCIQIGLDDSYPQFKKNRPYSILTLLAFSSYMIVSTCNSVTLVYNTDFISRYNNNLIYRRIIVVSVLLQTLSWIATLGITINSEGFSIHWITAITFFTLSAVQRVLYLPRKKNILSKFKLARTYTTLIATVLLMISLRLLNKEVNEKKENSDDENEEKMNEIVLTKEIKIKEFLITIAEIILIGLFHWERIDAYRYLEFYMKNN